MSSTESRDMMIERLDEIITEKKLMAKWIFDRKKYMIITNEEKHIRNNLWMDFWE